MKPISFKRHRFPPDVIRYAVRRPVTCSIGCNSSRISIWRRLPFSVAVGDFC